jgi:hypothetical protein
VNSETAEALGMLGGICVHKRDHTGGAEAYTVNISGKYRAAMGLMGLMGLMLFFFFTEHSVFKREIKKAADFWHGFG